MGERKSRIVLFVGAANHRRSRFAEILFNSVAERMGLPWRASSRGLALPRATLKTPMDPTAVRALEALGVRALIDCARRPALLAVEDLEKAELVITLDEAGGKSLGELFPDWAEKAESWQVDDSADALARVEREVMELTARLLGGRRSEPDQEPAPAGKPGREVKPGTVVKVSRETKGRRGKGVTIVSELPLDEAALQELAARLKQKCGTGGTVKDGRIEIQGDQRDRLASELEALGYRVKKAGG